jgi:hypothetical protein
MLCGLSMCCTADIADDRGPGELRCDWRRPSAGVTAGVLLQTSALTMTAGAALRLVIDGGARDQIRTATATLGGAALILDFAAPNAIGTQITLIDVTGASAQLFGDGFE